ncbi:MAG TPA: hypothetical protein VKG25_28010 [Bryobacteraceae bacterium]|nr:hypothetical protein [Bryobacteraceae bacterium]
MTLRDHPRGKDVFVNCPFDVTYKPIFEAIVFAVRELGFFARCALEVDDSSEVRLTRITRIIEQCTYGIHDISSVGLGAPTNLPRFNMPLELGLYLGCKFFGSDAQKKKACLILDSEPYRYRASISDISGQDIHAHHGQPKRAIAEVRNWLANASKTKGLPGGEEIAEHYARFAKDLPNICRNLRRQPNKLTFADFSETVEIWLKLAR